MSKINVELVTPEELVFSVDADMVVVPGAEGDFGVLHKHAPLISNIRQGVVSLVEGSKTREIFVSDGFAEVTGESCIILADKAVDLAKVSKVEAEKLVKQAEEA